MGKEFDLKKKTKRLHMDRIKFKELARTPRGANYLIKEIKENESEIFTGSATIDFLNSMCQVAVSFRALKRALEEKEPELLQKLHDCGFKYIEL